MSKEFSLTSDEEPTDEQLHMIMADALKDVLETKIIIKETYERMMKKALEESHALNDQKIKTLLSKK